MTVGVKEVGAAVVAAGNFLVRLVAFKVAAAVVGQSAAGAVSQVNEGAGPSDTGKFDLIDAPHLLLAPDESIVEGDGEVERIVGTGLFFTGFTPLINGVGVDVSSEKGQMALAHFGAGKGGSVNGSVQL